MDINIFETFLQSQWYGFEAFLKGCRELDREYMRIALNTHSMKMTFTLATEFPILGVGPGIASPFDSPTPQCSVRHGITSPGKTPLAVNHLRSQSPPASSRSFMCPGEVPEIPRLGPVFKRNTNAAITTPVNTSKSNKNVDPDSASTKNSAHGNFRTPCSAGSGKSRSGMTVGGARRLFKPRPSTPIGKDYARDNDSSAGSPLSSDEASTKKRSHQKRIASSRYNKSAKSSNVDMTPKSPFELAAREAERKKPHADSESTSDFDIPLRCSKFGIRKVSSAKSQREKTMPKKNGGDMMDIDDDDDDREYSEDQETPSKKQKRDGVRRAA